MKNIINGFELVNEDKMNRAINGSMSAHGSLTGGVGEDASEEAILAEYDRLGGLIKKGKYVVKTGSFYDFAGKKPRKTPEVIYVFRGLDGEQVEVPDGEDIPMEVKAAQMVGEKKGKKVKKGKPSIEDDETDA